MMMKIPCSEETYLILWETPKAPNQFKQSRELEAYD